MKIGKRTLGVAVTTALLAATSTMAIASSHREAPGITKQPKIDGTDFYMFRSYEPGRAGYVTLIANYQPIQTPYGGPNYFTMDADAIYEIHIDNDGDAVEDITFQFDFNNALATTSAGAGQAFTIDGKRIPIPLRQSGVITAGDTSKLNEIETYTVTMVTGDRRSGTRSAVTKASGGATFTKPIDYIGTKTLPNYENYANSYITEIKIPGCSTNGKVFAGQRAEAFAVNLGEIFDLVNFVPLDGTQRPGGIINNRANDDLVDKANVTSLALEVPIACLTGSGNGVIGAWTTSSLPQAEIEDPSPTYEGTSVYGGAWVQQSRLSNPLVNEVVIGLPDKDRFNASEPKDDADATIGFGEYVFRPVLPELLEALFPSVTAPNNFPRADLTAAFLTGFKGVNQLGKVTASEMLRLNTGVDPTPRNQQSSFGVAGEDIAGFPNGRRPGDDTVDIALRVVMGRLCYPLQIGSELSNDPSKQGTPQDDVDLGLCNSADAPSGQEPFIDGAPIAANELQNAFPYLNTPLPGAM